VTVPETFPRLFCAACVVVGFAGVAGLGGVANSSLTFDDTPNANHSLTVTVTNTATGGNGGGGGSGSVGAAGAAATASNTLTALRRATGDTDAFDHLRVSTDDRFVEREDDGL